jgi:hypothetical protein
MKELEREQRVSNPINKTFPKEEINNALKELFGKKDKLKKEKR